MKRDFKITDASGGVALAVNVVTRASRVELAAIDAKGGALKIRLTASPAGGESNYQLIDFLADILEVDPKQIEIIAGENAKSKLITIKNISPDFVDERLRASVSGDGDDDDF